MNDYMDLVIENDNLLNSYHQKAKSLLLEVPARASAPRVTHYISKEYTFLAI